MFLGIRSLLKSLFLAALVLTALPAGAVQVKESRLPASMAVRFQQIPIRLKAGVQRVFPRLKSQRLYAST
jgi:hypothetical protein